PAPALFIRGGQSDYVANEDLALIRQAFPAAELISIEAAGHLPHVQTPAEFTALVDAFLN
ncbi:MAG: alpha/beta hydrolase, partial [Thiothrix litoralis]